MRARAVPQKFLSHTCMLGSPMMLRSPLTEERWVPRITLSDLIGGGEPLATVYSTL
jgi:hypothetical protein